MEDFIVRAGPVPRRVYAAYFSSIALLIFVPGFLSWRGVYSDVYALIAYVLLAGAFIAMVRLGGRSPVAVLRHARGVWMTISDEGIQYRGLSTIIPWNHIKSAHAEEGQGPPYFSERPHFRVLVIETSVPLYPDGRTLTDAELDAYNHPKHSFWPDVGNDHTRARTVRTIYLSWIDKTLQEINSAISDRAGREVNTRRPDYFGQPFMKQRMGRLGRTIAITVGGCITLLLVAMAIMEYLRA